MPDKSKNTSEQSKKEKGERLKAVRLYLGLTQAQMGEVLGLKWHKIKDIETGVHNLTPELALEIEDKYNIIDFKWLLTGRGEMTSVKKDINDLLEEKSNIDKETKEIFEEIIKSPKLKDIVVRIIKAIKDK